MNSNAAPERLSHLFDAFVSAYAELNEFLIAEWPSCKATYPPTLNQTLRFFISAMTSRARAAFILLQAGSYWESEIVLRSHLEAAIKCLTFARRSNVDLLLQEYWIDLQSSSDRKAALKAKDAGNLFAEDGIDRRVFDSLANPDWFDVEPKLNKKQRRTLDHQWSVPELVKRLQTESDTITPLKHIESLMHGYGMQSEILHVSSKYYDLLWDRMLRINDLEALENGHFCRQLAEPLQLTALCVDISLDRLGVKCANPTRPFDIAQNFSDLTKPYQSQFAASQDDFYSKMS